MPIVLVTAEGKSSSGYTYDDRTGISYEYPLRYAKLVQTGEPFAYHVGGRGYIGSGIVGEITESTTAGRLVCEILDYVPFEADVALMGPEGHYYEADPSAGKLSVFWSQGVRPVSTLAFEQIVWSAPTTLPNKSAVSGYASSEVAIMVESISMNVAAAWLEVEYAGEIIARMPHNNPGYDIRVGENSSPKMFVEVKGTQASVPTFWLSEGERKFSINNADKYLFIVVSGINLKSDSTPIVTTRYGALVGADVEMAPSQWRGSLITSA